VDDGSSQSSLVTLTASKGMGNSRTAIVGTQTVWSAGDQIYVSSKDGKVTGVLTLEAEYAGKTEGTFSGFVFGNPKSLEYSVFPAPKNGTVIDLSTIEGAGEVDAPMIGKIDFNAETDVQFANACGVLLVNLPNAVGMELEISATDKNSTQLGLSAKTDVTDIEWNNGSPKLKFIANAEKNITITDSDGGEMYVPYIITDVGNKDLSEVTFNEEKNRLIVNKASLLDNQGNLNVVGSYVSTGAKVHTYNVDTKSFNTNTKVESLVTSTTKTEDGKVQGKVEAVITQENINDSMNNDEESGSIVSNEVAYFNVSPSVTTDQSTNQPIEVKEVVVTLPQVESDEQKAEVSISNISKDATVTINEEEINEGDDSKNSIKELTVVLPSGTTEAEAKEKVVINMPNTTVTVKSADGNVLIIDNMEASTAPNTLVVEKDVVIKNLNLQKGSLQVFGRIDHLTVSGNKKDILYIVIEVGGSIGKITGNESYEIVDKNKGEDLIIIPNPQLSQFLLDDLGSDKVTINPSTKYAEMKKSDVITVGELIIDNFDEDLNDYTINSLVGIEHFINLTKLICVQTQLKGTVDLSKNTNIQEIDVNFNPELTGLNIDGLVNLTSLKYNETAIEKLNIPEKAVPYIKVLNYGRQRYDEKASPVYVPDVNKFTSLKELACYGQDFTLTNPEIKAQLTDLQCYMCEMDELDLSEYTNLYGLTCYANNLTELIIPENSNIGFLCCYGNKLTTLDVTPLGDNLGELWCGSQENSNNNQLTLYVTENQEARWNSEWNENIIEPNVLVTLKVVDNIQYVVIENTELSAAIMEEIKKDELVLSGEVTLNENNYAVMTQAVADEVTKLDFGWGEYTITSLSGIENFKYLTRLECNNTGLKTCDLGSNTNLEFVSLCNNNLTSLEFTNHPNLFGVFCSGNYNLTSLNVQKCEKLSQIAFANAKFTTITIPNWQNLEYLDYSNTAETISFDLSKFTKLDCLVASGKGLTELNFSEACRNTLTQLLVESNQLTSFNFSKYPNLWSFHCDNNQIKELDLSEAKKLGYFSCDYNYIKSLDITNTIIKDVVEDGLRCGNQKDNINLVLTLTEAQKATCTDEWRNNNPRVFFPGETTEVPEGTGSLDEFGNGGVF